MRSNTGERADPASSEVPLPPERAFVIQLRPAPDGDGELFTGRAEHIASGLAARFASVQELIEFVQQVLATQRGSNR